MAANVDLALEDEKKAFKAYLTAKNVSEKSANVAISKAFGIWKLKDRETFEKLMKSDSFEKDARALLVEIYKGNEKKAAAYYSELKRYYIYYLEKNGLPVPSELKNSKPGRKPGSASKKKAATKKTAAKKTTKKAAAKKTTATKTAAKKTTAKAASAKKVAAKKTTAKKTVKAAAAKTAAPKRGRKPSAAKAAAAKKTTVKKTAGRKAAVRTAAKKPAARSASSSSNTALVKAINELNKTLAPIAKLASKLK